MRRFLIWRGRWRLHMYLLANPEIGTPCHYGSKLTCECHHVARPGHTPRYMGATISR